jgi:site-specific DNA recombinase
MHQPEGFDCPDCAWLDPKHNRAFEFCGNGAKAADSPAVRPSDYDATLPAIERVVMSRTTIEIELAEGMTSDDQNRILIIPWTPPSPHRRREIIQGEGERPSPTRPMRTEARAVLTDALRDAHRWLDELTTSPNLNIGSLAARDGKTERWIRRTISLAFLCPALVKAAIDGRLPRGFGVKRLMDLPMAWSDQWSALGLTGASSNGPAMGRSWNIAAPSMPFAAR